jgi:hypothetical protein
MTTSAQFPIILSMVTPQTLIELSASGEIIDDLFWGTPALTDDAEIGCHAGI